VRNGRALLAAMGRASSLVSSLAAERRPGLILEIHVGQRLPVGVADDEDSPYPSITQRRRELGDARSDG
jgi:hypothetical protein